MILEQPPAAGTNVPQEKEKLSLNDQHREAGAAKHIETLFSLSLGLDADLNS